MILEKSLPGRERRDGNVQCPRKRTDDGLCTIRREGEFFSVSKLLKTKTG